MKIASKVYVWLAYLVIWLAYLVIWLADLVIRCLWFIDDWWRKRDKNKRG